MKATSNAEWQKKHKTNIKVSVSLYSMKCLCLVTRTFIFSTTLFEHWREKSSLCWFTSCSVWWLLSASSCRWFLSLCCTVVNSWDIYVRASTLPFHNKQCCHSFISSTTFISSNQHYSHLSFFSKWNRSSEPIILHLLTRVKKHMGPLSSAERSLSTFNFIFRRGDAIIVPIIFEGRALFDYLPCEDKLDEMLDTSNIQLTTLLKVID